MIVLRDDHLGDMILTTPLARGLAQAGYEAIVVGQAAWAPVWIGNANARYVSLQSVATTWPVGIGRLARWLRQQHPCAILVPHHSRRLLSASALSGCRRRYCQLGRWWGRLTLHDCMRTRINTVPRYMGQVWQDLLMRLGAECVEPKPDLFLSRTQVEDAKHHLATMFRRPGPLVVVHPFDGGSACNLPLARYVGIVRFLCAQGARVVVTGTAEDRSRWTAVTSASDAHWNACGELSLQELFAVIHVSRFIVVGNTGPLHVAHACGVPSLTVFCPQPVIGSPLWRNSTAGSIVLRPSDGDCARRCGRPGAICAMNRTPTDETIHAALQQALAAIQDRGGDPREL